MRPGCGKMFATAQLQKDEAGYCDGCFEKRENSSTVIEFWLERLAALAQVQTMDINDLAVEDNAGTSERLFLVKNYIEAQLWSGINKQTAGMATAAKLAMELQGELDAEVEKNKTAIQRHSEAQGRVVDAKAVQEEVEGELKEVLGKLEKWEKEKTKIEEKLEA